MKAGREALWLGLSQRLAQGTEMAGLTALSAGIPQIGGRLVRS